MNFDELKILIIDDSEGMLDMLGSLLYELGVKEVIKFSSASLALTSLTDKDFKSVNLIICDQYMKDLTGVEFLLEIRENYSKEDLPFILLTSSGTRDVIVTLVENGGNDFIVKPPSVEILKEKIIEHLDLSI